MLLTRAVLIVSCAGYMESQPVPCSLCQQSTFWRNPLLLVFAHSVSLVLGCCVALT